MKKAVWKYNLSDRKRVVFKIPAGAKILSVQPQAGAGVMWVLVEPDKETEDRTFAIRCTGDEFDVTHKEKYIGTYQLAGGSYVLHVFEISNEPLNIEK